MAEHANRVTVIDYKAGNLTSVVKALRSLGVEVAVTDRAADVPSARRIILPGVGHFAATKRLDETGLTAEVRSAIDRGTPFLGICVGMQWLMEGSTEAPDQVGLGYFKGVCERFPEGTEKVPHVGWNRVLPASKSLSRILTGVSEQDGGEFAYFTHSYRVPANVTVHSDGDLPGAAAAGITDYVGMFASVIEHRNVFGVQFHPEKSSDAGLRILRNFLELQPC
jgi:glutamine amidotransferase